MRCSSIVIGGVVLLLAGRASSRDALVEGMPSPAAALPRADALFAEAKRLLDAGQVPEACSVFEESQRLVPRGGTLLNLALCREREGNLGAARRDLQAALARAQRDGRHDRVPIAREHLSAVEAALAQAAEAEIRARLRAAELLLARGRAAEACALADAAVVDADIARVAGETPALWHFLGRCHMRLRQAEQARLCYRRYLALVPAAPDAGFVRAIVGPSQEGATTIQGP